MFRVLMWSKVQGITIKKGRKVVVHGHKKIPDSMYYLMLSRAQEMKQIYMENFTKKIKANPRSLAENENLVKRSIVPSYHNNRFCVFMLNIQSLQNKLTELKNDVYAKYSDHICLVETWIDPLVEKHFHIPGR